MLFQRLGLVEGLGKKRQCGLAHKIFEKPINLVIVSLPNQDDRKAVFAYTINDPVFANVRPEVRVSLQLFGI